MEGMERGRLCKLHSVETFFLGERCVMCLVPLIELVKVDWWKAVKGRILKQTFGVQKTNTIRQRRGLNGTTVGTCACIMP